MLLIGISTIVLTLSLCLFAIGKILAPTAGFRDAVRRFLALVAEIWIGINNFVLSLYRQPRWHVDIPPDLDRRKSYVVACNHQSWVDILVLQ
ncbi:MAG: acyltransferase, partial [Xanthomonadales bacterium]|nr:acyltransferase [Xanthomonadales bacterium]